METPSKRWYVKGYVKKSGTNQALSNAKVVLYNDAVYIGTTYTSSSGYFSISTTRKPTNYEFGWQITVSKAGYVTTRRYAFALDYVTNFGNIYLTPTPPPEPPEKAVISNVIVTVTGTEITISWNVDWDDTCTAYLSKCWWSQDTSIDSEDLFFSTTTKQPAYTITVPAERIPFEGGTCHYQIYARNSKNGYYPETYYGPKEFVIEGTWTIAPTDDAYTQEYDPSEGDTNYNTEWLYVGGNEHTGLNARTWLRFYVPNLKRVKKAILKVFYHMDNPSNNGGISDYIEAYISDSNWDETTITHNNATAVGILLDTERIELPAPYTGKYQLWDVTAALAETDDDYLSITLCGTENGGPHLYSKEQPDHKPYLEVTYTDATTEIAPELEPLAGCTFARDTLPDGWVASSIGGDDDNDPWFSYETGIPDAGMDYIYEDGGYLRWCTQYHGAMSSYVGEKIEVKNFRLEKAFFISVRLGWNLYNSYDCIFAVALLDSEDNEITYIELNGAGNNEWEKSRILGKVGTSDAIASKILPDSTQESRFEFQRFGYDNRIRLVWYPKNVDSPEIITEDYYDTRAICGLRIRYTIKSDGRYLQYSQAAMVNSVKQIPVEELQKPTVDVAKFDSPLDNLHFNLMSDGALAAWTNEEGSPVTGEQVSVPSLTSGKAWKATSNGNTWIMKQRLESSTAASELNAIRSRCVYFAIMARAVENSYGTLNLQAVILYKAADRRTPTIVKGIIYTIPKNNDAWQRVGVRTTFPIPENLEWLEVKIIGRTTNHEITFEAYIDEAAFSIITDAVAPKEWSYSDPCYRAAGERGMFALSLQTYYANLISNVYEVETGVNLNVEALNGYYIRKIDVIWKVDDSNLNYSPHSASLPTWTNPNSGLQEGNFYDEHSGDWTYPPNSVVTEWNARAAYLTNPGLRTLMKFGIGGLFYATGVGFPLSTTISSMVDMGMNYLCQPIYLGAANYMATVNHPGTASVFYPTGTSVTFTRLFLDLTWNIGVNSSKELPAMLRVDVRVQYSSSTNDSRIDVTQTQSIIIVLQVK
ncbi:MAG: DNRLRE domain-containing protein [Candidatus Heimdallarchaeota archaeon]